MFPPGVNNVAICFSDVGARTDYVTLAVDGAADLHFGSSVDAYQQVSLYTFDQQGNQQENITDWVLDQFKKHYQPGRARTKRLITKNAIFHYVYGLLHDPIYRKKYAQNLQREFPRIPCYSDFWAWADWGKELMDLHLGYEKVAPAKLQRTDRVDENAKESGTSLRVLLRADKDAGRILIDTGTILAGIPAKAWEYRLGNRCALEWILDQYKERKPKDPSIREKFNTYRFADHKEAVIDLLARVTTVSLKTVEIVEAMRKADH